MAPENPGWPLAVAGMAQADAAEHEAWKTKADAAIDQLAKSGKDFTAEDVRAIAGDPSRPNAFGARIQAAKRDGTIVRVGYRASQRASLHAHPIAVWRGAF
jgi:D-arabinose 1-dehydrogenase-like Zn-dependent alcohol dehydrogenase